MPLRGRHVILGVTGGIAAYKAVLLLRELQQAGATVRVAMTQAATRFVGQTTFEALSGAPAFMDVFTSPGLDDGSFSGSVPHVELAHWADLMVVAPATADSMARMAQGRADDAVTTLALATPAPLVVVPAMETRMWEHPLTKRNLVRLKEEAGYLVVPPEDGALASGRFGSGRMAELRDIVQVARCALAPQDLSNRRILVSAGPTRESLDPVRFVTNHSSGRMGYAVAEAAWSRGAEVVLVSGPTELPKPYGVERIEVETAAEMADALMRRAPESDALVMSAAVADYRPKQFHDQKLKKSIGELSLELARTTDILWALAELGQPAIRVGFAAETQNAEAEGRRKLEHKKLDFIVVNRVGAPGVGFGSKENAGVILGADGSRIDVPRCTKLSMAHQILDAVSPLVEGRANAQSAPVPAAPSLELGPGELP